MNALRVLALILALVAFGAVAQVAIAQDDDADVTVDVDTPDGITISDEEGVVEIGEPVSEDAETEVGGIDLDEQSPLELWEMLSALLIPLVVGAINRQGWPVQYKNGALLAVSLVVTAVGLYFQGDLDRVEDWATTFMTIAIASYALYNTLWQAFPLPQYIESKTGGDPLSTSKYRFRRT